MKRQAPFPAMAGSRFLPIAAIGLAAAIFVIDTITDLEIAVPVLYTAVILISFRFCTGRGVIFVAAGCIALTLLSDLLTTTGSWESGIINTVISLLAIMSTTYLVLKIEAAEATMDEARAQLVHVGRVTMLGELTASIAHEVNQPLAATVINGNASLRWLAAEPPNLDEARHAIESIVKDANRAGDVIARVRGLYKKIPPQKDSLNINDLILDVITLTTGDIQHNRVSLRMQLSDDVPLIRADRIQLQQVILNLIFNSIEAMNGVAEGSRKLLVSTAPDQSNAVLVTICDTGPGLDPGKIENIFDAFYTTKRDGLGMGLAISRSIIEAHGGRISAKPNTPRGAVFKFTLPTDPVKAS